MTGGVTVVGALWLALLGLLVAANLAVPRRLARRPQPRQFDHDRAFRTLTDPRHSTPTRGSDDMK